MNTKELTTSLVLPVTSSFIDRRIHLIRGQKVMLDSDLAELYQVEVRVLIQAVKRNIGRFPDDFFLQLSPSEATALRSQFVTSKEGKGGRRYLPYVFTELGVAMLSSVLKSEQAIQMNVYIMRAFMKLRELLASHKELAEKIELLEKEQGRQGNNIEDINIALNKLLQEKKSLKSAVGFGV